MSPIQNYGQAVDSSLLHEALVCIQNRDFDLALHKISIVESRCHGNICGKAYYVKGTCYLIMHDFEEAKVYFLKSLSCIKEESTYYNLSKCEYELRNYSRALQLINEAILLNNSNGFNYLQKGKTLIKLDSLEEGIEFINLSLKMGSDLVVQLEGNEIMYNFYFSNSNFTEALENLNKLIDITDENYDYRFDRIGLLLRNGQYVLAKEDIDSLILSKKGTYKLVGNLYLAYYYTLINQLDSANTIFLENGVYNVDLGVNSATYKGEFDLRKGDYSGAVENFTKDINSNNGTHLNLLLFHRAMVYIRLEEWELARQDLMDAKIQYTNDLDLIIPWLFFVELQLGQTDKLKELKKMTSTNSLANYLLGIYFFELKRDEEAEQYFLLYLQSSKIGFGEVYYYLGKIYDRKGNLDLRNKYFETALSCYIENSEMREEIKLVLKIPLQAIEQLNFQRDSNKN